MDRKRRIGRETVGVLILVALLLAGLLSSWQMGRIHNTISRQLEDAAWYALAENWEDARKMAISAESQWWDHRDLAALLADHTPMEQIDAAFARISAFSAARDSMEFAAACAELSRQVQAMGEAQRLSWQNLF